MNGEQPLTRPVTTISRPTVTIGVYGGVVQWVRGNSFPIRIVDYDGEPGDKPDEDDEGEPCTIWDVPADTSFNPAP